MKKTVIATFLALIFAMPCFSAEKMTVDVSPKNSYLIMLKNPADAVMTNDDKILNAKILTTIYNEKNQIIVKVLKEGMAKLYIAIDKDVAIIEFNSNQQNIDTQDFDCSKNVEAFLKIDTPFMPRTHKKEQFKLDPPPPLGGAR